MKILSRRFNLYFLIFLAGLLAVGCSSPEKKRGKALSSLRVHGEGAKDAGGRTSGITVFRAKPIPIQIERSPLATEGNVREAKLVDVMGGFAIQIQFDRRGSWLIEQFTTMNRGKRLAIFSQFVSPPAVKPNDERWLAAPKISQPITNGLLIFTPDATEEEARQIVQGLNNAAKKYQDKELDL
ncbi:MAG: hypothetical protein WCR20_10010 [Verrucomicrobiota bacterium]|jgi:hypothetical protein|nr:hypothetical protein [Verrucomicrobiota bacterium]